MYFLGSYKETYAAIWNKLSIKGTELPFLEILKTWLDTATARGLGDHWIKWFS